MLAALAPLAHARVTVAESTPSRLVLDWELRGLDTASVSGLRGFETRVDYDGGNIPLGDSGAALFYGYSLNFGTPPRGDVRVSVEPLEVSVITLAHPPRKRGRASEDAGPVWESKWASAPVYGKAREYRFANVILRPLSEMGRGWVQILRRARIVVEFPPAAHGGAPREPRGEHERMVKELLLNFGVAQGWQSQRGLRKAAAAAEAHPLSFAGNQKFATFKVGDGHRGGNEAVTGENSLIKIGGRAIIAANLASGSNIPMNSVALYASVKGELDPMPPAEGEIPAGVFEVPVMRFDVNGNSVVDPEDYIIAYVSGATDWSYARHNQRGWEFTFDGPQNLRINRYDDRRNYWLTLKSGAGAEMGAFVPPVPAGPIETIDTFYDNMFLRAPTALNESNAVGGIDWAWMRMTVSRGDTLVPLRLPGIGGSDSVSLRFAFGRSNSYLSSVSAFLKVSAVYADTVCTGCAGDVWYSVPGRGVNLRDINIKFTNTSADANDRSRAFYEVNGLYARYRRPLTLSAQSGKLEVFSSVDSGLARYRITRASGVSPAYIVRVPLDEREITFVDTVERDSYVFADTGGRGVRYMVMLKESIVDYTDSLVAAPVRSVVDNTYQIRDLRNAGNRADFLIITHADFLDASIKLAKHKAGMGFGNPKVVLVRDIMDQFAGGNTDPAAIRNFLLYVSRGNWHGGADLLTYVVLMGSGHYDYKGVSSRAVNYMPIFYISFGGSENSFGDDYYTYFEPSVNPSLQNDGFYAVGRIPAKSPSEALDIVDKIIETEDPRAADMESWRNRVLLTADDDQQGPSRDNISGDQAHFESSGRITRIIEARRPDVDIRKVYLFEYPWDDNYTKPGAKRAFINEINAGVSAVNFFGHGNISQLADEALLSRADVTALYNRKRYPLFTMFSCSIGKHDQPANESLGEMLVRQPRAGAIAVVASTRDVSAYTNEALARPYYEKLFDDGDNLSIGLALAYAKKGFAGSMGRSNKYYVLIGDPSVKMSARTHEVGELRIRDGVSGAVITDTLKALQRITITGSAGSAFAANDSTAFVSLMLLNPPDSARRKDRTETNGKFSDPVYVLPGKPVFSGKIPIDPDGAFSYRLQLPMNLPLERPGVKLTAYAWREGRSISAAGHVGGLVFFGTDGDSIDDTIPPKISIRPLYNTDAMDQAELFVKNRVTAQLPLNLSVKIEDASGINVTGTGPDEGLTMEVKGALSKRGINHLFGFSGGDFSQGEATLTFDEGSMKSGTYELVISAQDLLGNVGKQSFTLEITDPADLKLDHVINIPNPVRMGRETRFYYYHSNTPGDFKMDVTIRVYSLGGRLLTVIRNPRNGHAWVPRDQRGNLLSPNVYLYQITASSPNTGKTVKSKIKKLAIHPPR